MYKSANYFYEKYIKHFVTSATLQANSFRASNKITALFHYDRMHYVSSQFPMTVNKVTVKSRYTFCTF